MNEYRQPDSSEAPTVVWIVHSDPDLREALVTAARHMGLAATPMGPDAQALDCLIRGRGVVPDLILFDDSEAHIPPDRLAAALAHTLVEQAPPVVYMVESLEASESLSLAPLKLDRDVVLRKPVLARDVIRAIMSALGRSVGEATVLRSHDLELDVLRRMLVYEHRNVHLTAFECGFLQYLMRRRGYPVAIDELLEQVWGFEPGTGTASVIRAHVRNLRRKLQLLGAPPQLISTVPRRGYLLR